MGKSRREREQQERKQKRRSRRNTILFCSILILILVAIFSIRYLTAPKPAQQLAITPAQDGSLSIPTASLDNSLTYIDYGGDYQLLATRDADGSTRLAFNVCEECYNRGDVHYSLNSDGNLTCDSCGSTFALADLGLANWGGCQPLAIPADYRADTESTAVVPAEVFSFAEIMFQKWDVYDYTQTLGDYQP